MLPDCGSGRAWLYQSTLPGDFKWTAFFSAKPGGKRGGDPFRAGGSPFALDLNSYLIFQLFGFSDFTAFPTGKTSITMKRRNFLIVSSLSTAGTLCAPHSARATVAPSRIRWTRNEKTGMVSAVACDGQPLALLNPGTGVLGASLRIGGRDAAAAAIRLGADLAEARLGPLRVELKHRLLDSGAGEDVLAAEMVIRNESDQAQQVEAMFLTALRPDADLALQQIHIPLSAAGGSHDPRFAELGVANFLEDCEQQVGEADFACHYLEPMASFPAERTTRALLLAPVVDILHSSRPWRVALFMPSDQPARFRSTGDYGGGRVWEMGRTLTVPPGGTATLRGWLHLHTGDAAEAWRAFHRFGHHEDHPAVEWTRNFRVHYYDFLSSAEGKNGRRGNGYEADLKHFREFNVGLATQHGYYPCMGDHLHPDRKEWLAMKGSPQGPAKMSIAKIKERIKATRAAGAKAGIYMHLTAFDDSSNKRLLAGTLRLLVRRGMRRSRLRHLARPALLREGTGAVPSRLGRQAVAPVLVAFPGHVGRPDEAGPAGRRRSRRLQRLDRIHRPRAPARRRQGPDAGRHQRAGPMRASLLESGENDINTDWKPGK